MGSFSLRAAAKMYSSNFDGAVSFHASPYAITPSAKERNDIRADVIFAKNFERSVGRRYTLMNESIDPLLPGSH
jgi:hypothetical protein